MLLAQCHCRWEPADEPDVGSGTLINEPARVRRDRLEVALAGVGVDRAEGERGLPRAGDPGEGNHGVAGDVDVERSQVVFAGATDGDVSGNDVARVQRSS